MSATLQNKIVNFTICVLALAALIAAWRFVLLISVLTGLLGLAGFFSIFFCIIICESGMYRYYNKNEPKSLPGSMAVDALGNLYYVDPSKHCLLKFDPKGQLIARWGREGGDLGQFYYPTGVAVDRQGQIYVAELGNYRVQKLDSQGRCLASWDGAPSLNQPDRIALSPDGNTIYVSDISKHCILKFDRDLRFLGRLGNEGRAGGQFRYPGNLTVDPNGQLFVADTLNGRVQKLDPGGRFLAELGSEMPFSNPEDEEARPSGYPGGVAVDPHDGSLYITTAAGKVQKFDGAGQEVFNRNFTKEAQVGQSYSLTLDQQGQLYVLVSQEQDNRRRLYIDKYNPTGQLLSHWRLDRRFRL